MTIDRKRHGRPAAAAVGVTSMREAQARVLSLLWEVMFSVDDTPLRVGLLRAYIGVAVLVVESLVEKLNVMINTEKLKYCLFLYQIFFFNLANDYLKINLF